MAVIFSKAEGTDCTDALPLLAQSAALRAGGGSSGGATKGDAAAEQTRARADETFSTPEAKEEGTEEAMEPPTLKSRSR